jgi:hypothetical protein
MAKKSNVERRGKNPPLKGRQSMCFKILHRLFACRWVAATVDCPQRTAPCIASIEQDAAPLLRRPSQTYQTGQLVPPSR